MRTYDIWRFRIQRRKKSLKCLILGAVLLSLAGYCLAFTNFWQGRQLKDHFNQYILEDQGNQIEVRSDDNHNGSQKSTPLGPRVRSDGTLAGQELDSATRQVELRGQDEIHARPLEFDLTTQDGLNNQDEQKKQVSEAMTAQHGLDMRSSANETMANANFQAEVEAKTVQIKLLSEPILYNYGFDDIRNPVNACAVSRTQVLIVVASSPENFQKRNSVRKGRMGEYARDPSNNAKLLFFMGRPACGIESVKVQAHIADEFYANNDIVQENFEDTFKNIRLKTVSMLRWTVRFCRDAKFVIRIDDDVIANMPKIVSVMEAKSAQYFDFILGDIKSGWKPVREDNTEYLKYFVSKEEYSDPTYPPFAVSGLTGYPLSTVSLLYQAAMRVKPLWLDDVFITGICAAKLRVPLLSDPDFIFSRE